jgi:hypothetical protein
MTDTLTALDATFLELEQQDEGALMSIRPPSRTAPHLRQGPGAPRDRRERGCRNARRAAHERDADNEWVYANRLVELAERVMVPVAA